MKAARALFKEMFGELSAWGRFWLYLGLSTLVVAAARESRADAIAALTASLAPLRPLVSSPLVGDGWAIVSASPELFLARRGRPRTSTTISTSSASWSAAVRVCRARMRL